jgi:hypothetical protein
MSQRAGFDTLLSEIPAEFRNRLQVKFELQTTDALRGITECLKMLSMASVGAKAFAYLISQDLDNIWHELILETRLYHRVCSLLPGGQYVHHSAMDSTDHSADRQGQALATLATYVANFGPFEPSAKQWWPVLEFLCHELEIDLETLNSRLAMLSRAR